jgi:membrane-bound lytic murein transglycosylase D
MLLPIKRTLVVGSLLLLGHPGIPGPAAAEPEWASVSSALDVDIEGADVETTEMIPASLGDTLESVATELGLGSPFEEQQTGLVGSGPPEPRPGGPPDAPRVAGGPAMGSAGAPALIQERPEVRYYVDRFQTGYRRAVVESWLARSGRYAEMIRDVLAQKGLPEDLLFTAMIESGFDPMAVSRAGAKGLWQFMASTAQRYGLRVNPWLDERLDPEKSTWAAANYLRDLYAMFGSWHLVQAAYNAGEMRVARAIQGMRTSDFWQLSRSPLLAEETKSFVASIQAAAIIARAPDRYGFSVIPEDPLRYDVIRVPPSTSLIKIASLAGLSDGALRLLNPELRLAQTPPGEVYALKVPEGMADRVKAALRQPPAAVTVAPARTAPAARAGKASAAAPSRSFHVVQPRETVRAIAKRYGVSPAAILRWNRLSVEARIFPGDRLRVAALTPAERAMERESGPDGVR